MNIDEEPVDEVKEALVKFLTSYPGGYKEVARTMGVNPQHLYYILSGRNDPTLKTVMRILRHFPNEVELRRAMSLPILTRGEETELRVAPVDRVSGEVISQLTAKDQLITELLDQLKVSREDLKAIQEELREYARDFRDMAKSNFPESGSQSTAYPMYNQFERVVIEGFRSKPQAKKELAGPIDILKTIGCTLDADGVWGVPFTPMDIVVRT